MAILVVVFAEAAPQLRLFKQRYVDEVEREESQCPREVWPRDKNERLAKKNEHDPGDHWIPHVSVRPVKNEASRRIPWRESSLTLCCKTAQRGCEEDESDDAKNESCDLCHYLRERTGEHRLYAISCRQPDWNDDRDHERQRRNRQQVTNQDQTFLHALP